VQQDKGGNQGGDRGFLAASKSYGATASEKLDIVAVACREGREE
jgi:hypothetical protein